MNQITRLIYRVSANYRQTSNISRTLVDNKIVDHSDVVGAAPVGAAPTTSSFSTWQLASMDWAKTTARRDEKHWSFWGFDAYNIAMVSCQKGPTRHAYAWLIGPFWQDTLDWRFDGMLLIGR